MTVRTRVHAGPDDWARLRDEVVSIFGDRGILHCPGLASVLLDTGKEISAKFPTHPDDLGRRCGRPERRPRSSP